MDEKQIFAEMIGILKVYTKDTTLLEKATLSTHILDDLKVNSARLVDVIIKCEDVFGIAIEDDEADKIRTIGDAVELVKKKHDFLHGFSSPASVVLGMVGRLDPGAGLFPPHPSCGLARQGARRNPKTVGGAPEGAFRAVAGLRQSSDHGRFHDHDLCHDVPGKAPYSLPESALESAGTDKL
jgi:acyl carrier protein